MSQQTNLEDQLNQQQNPPPQSPPNTPPTPPGQVPPPVDPNQNPEVNELEQLKAQLAQYEAQEKLRQEQGLSEHEKQIKALEDQLREQASKSLVESKYFKEAELKNYTHDQLSAMSDFLQRIQKGGQPAKGAQTPKPNKPKEPLGRWKNPKTGEWEQ